IGHWPGDAHRRPARGDPHRAEPPASGMRRGARRHLLLSGGSRRRRPHGGGVPGPQAGARHAAPRSGRAEARPGRLLDGRRPDQRRAGRAQRRMPEHPGPVGPGHRCRGRHPGRSISGRRRPGKLCRLDPERWGATSMKVLLTGGAGYVGSACLRWLLTHGHNPIAYDDLSEGNRAAIPEAADRLIEGGIAETDRLAEVLRRHGIEAVMHFAALASVPDSIKDPEAYYRVNVAGTKSVLDAMRATGVSRFLFSS